MTTNRAAEIVQLLVHKELTNSQAEIGVLLISGLNRNDYMRWGEALLTYQTPPDVLETLLCPPLPYGPGYAYAYSDSRFGPKLVEMVNDPQCSERLRTLINSIINGENARIYGDYLKHPGRYGYGP